MTSLEAGIVTADAARLAAFYRDGLGFDVDQTLTFPQGTVLRLSRDRALFKIYQPVAGAIAVEAAEPWHQHSGFRYAALHVTDASTEIARAVAAGATVLVALNNHRPHAWFAMIADPDGNLWEILQEDALPET